MVVHFDVNKMINFLSLVGYQLHQEKSGYTLFYQKRQIDSYRGIPSTLREVVDSFFGEVYENISWHTAALGKEGYQYRILFNGENGEVEVTKDGQSVTKLFQHDVCQAIREAVVELWERTKDG